MNIHRFPVALACLGLVASLVACGTDVAGGGKDGETEDDAVLAVNLETGERQEFADAESVPEGWAVCEGEVCPDPLECTALAEAVCLGRADCAPLYGPDGTFGGCSDGGPTCAAEDCGPPPGMPAIECPDGSVGGNTGRCVESEQGCGWEIRECPAPTCDDEACGPPLGMPAYTCEDGSIGGNTGVCLSNPDGTCGWEVRECPEDSGCGADACGPPPPGLPCADGSGTIGECKENGAGVCEWEVRECPETLCDEADCGPMPGIPAYTCEDGSIGGNTGRCILYDGDMCGWENRECPEDAG